MAYFTEGMKWDALLMTRELHLQSQPDSYKILEPPQQGYNVWSCDIAAIKDPAGHPLSWQDLQSIPVNCTNPLSSTNTL